MSWLGIAHFIAAVAAIAAGAAVLARRKGGPRHRRAGQTYLGLMAVVNGAALLIYEDQAGPGAFHLLAVLSIATLAAGWSAIRGARGRPGRVAAHGVLMSWSWAGLLAAGAGQGAAALELPVWPAILAVLGGACLAIHSRDMGAAARQALRREGG